jgi:hypothetical protein
MKILELLLPKGIKNADLTPKAAERIDMLHKRMNKYVDKIGDPSTSQKGKEFLKTKLKQDYDELKDVIETVTEQRLDPSCWSGYKKSGTKMKGGVRVNNCVKNEDVNALPDKITDTKYEVYDRQTGLKAGGPYSTRSRARSAVDRLDNKYGGYRYGYRPIAKLTEAVHKLPLSDSDFELVKQLMLHRIPAAVAPIYIQEIIDDDEFNSMLSEFAEINPAMDVRPHVAEWIKRVMPDQLYRFNDSAQTLKQQLGQTSVIHGYEPEQYHGSNSPVTGNAYGRK